MNLDFWRRAFDTAAAGAHALGAAIDRRKALLPRLLNILNGEEIGTELEEVFGVLWSLVLGFWLLLPFDTFGVTKAFRVLNAFSVEGLWGFVLVAFALWRFDAILMNRVCTRHGLTLFGVTLWSSLGALFLIGNITSPGAALFFLVAALEMLSYRNLRIEVKR